MRKAYRRRRVETLPLVQNYKPVGIPRKLLKKTQITLDEYEAIRLADYLQLEHESAARKMQISRPTFTRLIQKARHQISRSIIEGTELVIAGGNVDMVHTRHHCRDCAETTLLPVYQEDPACGTCGSLNLENIASKYLGSI